MSDNHFVVPVHEKKEDNYLKLNFLLNKNRLRKGCSCTFDQGLKYTNPFFGNVQNKIIWGSKRFYRSCFITQNEAFKMHTLQLNSFGIFQDAINVIKPPIYASEWVIATENSVGCVYRLMVKLQKEDNIYEYMRDYKFSKAEKVQIDMEIKNYETFDTLSYCHYLTAPDNLSFKRLYSIKIGESSLKIGKAILAHFETEESTDEDTDDDIYDDDEQEDDEMATAKE